MAAEGTFPKVDGDTLYASEVNSFEGNRWNKIGYNDLIQNGLIRFSSSVWQTGDTYTSDSGATWSGDGFATWASLATATIADTDGVKGVSARADNATTAYISDGTAGNTWTTSTTAPSAGNMTKINTISIKGSTVVCGGDAGANESIYYSSDSGDTYTEATTGPTVEVFGIVMASSTIGYAVDSGHNIWKTTDSGVNWTDTTDGWNRDSTKGMTMFAIDTDTILLIESERAAMDHYVNSTNTVTSLIANNLSGTGNSITNIVKATNGNYYFLVMNGATSTATLSISILTMFRYDGTNVYMRPIGLAHDDNKDHYKANTTAVKPSFIEGAADKLELNPGDHILEISVIGD